MSVSSRLLSPQFSSSSWSSHSSFISCTSSRTSSTSLRAVASLCTPPERRWTLLTTPTSSQVMSPTPTTSRRLTSSPTQSSWPPRSCPSKSFPRTSSTMTPHFEDMLREARRVHSHHSQREDLSVGQSSSCVRKNGATCWRAKGATCWIDWSAAKRCKCTD